MKSERRHELATNELADWVTHFPEFVRKNRNTIVITAVVVVALVIYTFYYYTRDSVSAGGNLERITNLLEAPRRGKDRVVQGYVQGLGISDEFFMASKELEAMAADLEADSPELSAIVLIKRAELLRSELHYRSEEATADVFRYQIGQAREIYNKALEIAPDNMTIAAMAKFGLGLCAEELGGFDDARKIYQEIATDPRYEGSLYVTMAGLRAKTLGDYQNEILFTKVEIEVVEPASVFSAEPSPALEVDSPAETNSAGE